MILISACLAGIPCRMDGAAKPVPEIRRLVEAGKAVPVCPEQLGGLTTPRAPSERRPDGSVVNSKGQDVTAAFRLGAERTLAVCKALGCSCAILKARSPSCGKDRIYDGSFSKRLVPGHGVCAELLLEAGVQVLTEEEYLQRQTEAEAAHA